MTAQGEAPGSPASGASDMTPAASTGMEGFRAFVRREGERLYRDLPWRRTRDPYIVWLSEVMLQQTQVVRVEARMPEWLDRFPSIEALAAASTADVLAAWQGMGYNRRALALQAAAREIVERHGGVFPRDTRSLVALPGIGPATAQGIRAFAFDLPGVYLETNVRTVFLHHFFPDVPGVPDRELVPLVRTACPCAPAGAGERAEAEEDERLRYALPADERDTPRSWYYALLDYGAQLKKEIPNPSRRSAGYARQSRFEGSRRQKRAQIVRILLGAGERGEGALTSAAVHAALDEAERAAGRPPVELGLVEDILADLEREGFCARLDASEGDGERWAIR